MTITHQPIGNEADASTTRARVVIADDGPLVRALFRRILERSVAAEVVAEAGDGEEAIAAVAEHQPDLILLDVAMPKVDGLSAIPELRRRSPHTRIVLLSGFEGWQLDREATAHAADGYIEKQLDPETLVRSLREQCEWAVGAREALPTPNLSLTPLPAINEPDVAASRLFRLASVAAHDLRAPVQLISGFGQLLADTCGEALDDHGREFLSWILDAATSLDHMISDMLDYAVVDAVAPVWSTVDVDEVFATIRSRMQSDLERDRVSLTWDNLPRIVADEGHLNRILTNLLKNAIAYVPAGAQPWVHVSGERSGSSWIISVSDNGLGVPESEGEAIFGGLHRLHPKDQFPGTGIGLALCRKLVELRGGSIGVTAREGGGSRFWFSVPDATE